MSRASFPRYSRSCSASQLIEACWSRCGGPKARSHPSRKESPACAIGNVRAGGGRGMNEVCPGPQAPQRSEKQKVGAVPRSSSGFLSRAEGRVSLDLNHRQRTKSFTWRDDRRVPRGESGTALSQLLLTGSRRCGAGVPWLWPWIAQAVSAQHLYCSDCSALLFAGAFPPEGTEERDRVPAFFSHLRMFPH